MPRDPVCHMELTPDEGTIKQGYRGMTYFFCSEECRQRFLQNPEAIRKEEIQFESEGEVQSI